MYSKFMMHGQKNINTLVLDDWNKLTQRRRPNIMGGVEEWGNSFPLPECPMTGVWAYSLCLSQIRCCIHHTQLTYQVISLCTNCL